MMNDETQKRYPHVLPCLPHQLLGVVLGIRPEEAGRTKQTEQGGGRNIDRIITDYYFQELITRRSLVRSKAMLLSTFLIAYYRLADCTTHSDA